MRASRRCSSQPPEATAVTTPVDPPDLPIGAAVPGWTPRPRPPRAPMTGRYCRIEPLDAVRHARELHEANGFDRAGSMWTYLLSGPFASGAEYRAWLDERQSSDDPLFFAFLDAASGRAIGLGAYLRIDPASGSIEVGHLQYSPLMQRTAVATEAMYLMMRTAFGLGYRRYEWKCDALNARSRRAAERLGFTFEGVFRQALVYKGRNRDTAWYSILDSEWPRLEAAFRAWLDPGNFDATGHQRASLGRAGRSPVSRYTVYWQPGCTSCLRTKEFLRTHGIAFESVNVRADAGAGAALARLGARSVPVVARGTEFVHGQDLETVARFVGVALTRVRLEVPVLVARLLALLDSTAHLAAQLPPQALAEALPGRERTHLDLAYHVSQVVVAFLDAALGGRLTFEHFQRRAPGHLASADAAAAQIRSVSQALAVWWAANRSRLPTDLDTYYGRQPLHAALERTTWHVAQHARQLEALLVRRGLTPCPPLAPALLRDLPLPQDVWDAEVPFA
jgi:RimJ/RimL family protein N-acetyltransferase/glutaredoxin